MPYKIQNTKPVQYITYIVKERPDTFLVLIDLMAWGKKAMVVQVQQIHPIISPTILFMNIFLFWPDYILLLGLCIWKS